jgi:hypothetical protein
VAAVAVLVLALLRRLIRRIRHTPPRGRSRSESGGVPAGTAAGAPA